MPDAIACTLTAAAEDMEAKLSLVDKQVQPSVNALQHATLAFAIGPKPL